MKQIWLVSNFYFSVILLIGCSSNYHKNQTRNTFSNKKTKSNQSVSPNTRSNKISNSSNKNKLRFILPDTYQDETTYKYNIVNQFGVKMKYSKQLSTVAYFISSFKGHSFSGTTLMKLFPRFGLVYPWVSHDYLLGEENIDPRSPNFKMWVKKVLKKSKEMTHYGIASRGNTAVILMQQRIIKLAPFKSKINKGETLKIRGVTTSDILKISFEITTPKGQIVSYKTALNDNFFNFDFNLCTYNSKDGVYTFEVIASKKTGPEVAAYFPIICGNATVKSLKLKMQSTGKHYTDKTVKKIIFKRINQYRQEHKLQKLYWNDNVAAAADYYATEICKTDQVKHISSISGSPLDRVRKYGINPLIIGENLGTGNSPSEISDGWITSIGHRALLLNKEVQSAGIGICQTNDKNSGDTIIYAVFLAVKL